MNSFLRYAALTALALSVLTPAFGQTVPATGRAGFPIYNDCSIPLPGKPTQITASDVKLTDRYIKYYPDGVPEADQKMLRKLYFYFKDDPDGQAEWEAFQNKAITAISAWDMRKISKRRYVYTIGEELKPLAYVYIFTGNELVSDFIRGHLARAASMPIDFWIHAELRKLIPEKPQGFIETSYINQSLGTAIAAVRRNMSGEEISAIESAWYEKGYQTALNWLDAHTDFMGNFQAVIAVGAMYAAKYFNDPAGWDKAFSGLKFYVDNAILPDGSDYEGYGYFGYPVSAILKGTSVMSVKQIDSLLKNSNLSKSQQWRLAGMLLGKDSKGRPGAFRITYGDNPSAAKMWGVKDAPVLLASVVCRDKLAAWVNERWHQKCNYYGFLLKQKYGDRPVKALGPDEVGVPLMTTFQSGDCYIRSGWGDNDVVLGLKAMNGIYESKTYIHSRPEINSVNLGAYGEYLICNAASASYRSPIRFEHDLRSWRANIITVDEKDQLYPFNFKDFTSPGYPHAEIVRKEELPDGGMILTNEAKGAYATPMKQASRTVRYVPKGRYYIIKDVMIPEDGEPHRFDHRFFIFNHDFKTSISDDGQMVSVKRPFAELYIAVNASSEMNFEYREAYIHGLAKRDYDPDGPNQGKPGSAKGLQWSCESKSLTVISVLVPRKPGSGVPKIVFEDGSVTVNGSSCDISDL